MKIYFAPLEGITGYIQRQTFNKYFGDTVEGFFTDEPQYFRYQTPFSFELEKELLDEQ